MKVLKQAMARNKEKAQTPSFIGQGRPTARATQRATPLKEVTLNNNARMGQSMGLLEQNLRVFEFGECHVLLDQDALNGWHVSISHPHRYPTWDELAEIKFRLVPDQVTMGMLIPPQAQWINLHQNCFHLFEVIGIGDHKKKMEESNYQSS